MKEEKTIYLTSTQMLAKAIEQYEEFIKIYDFKQNAAKTVVIAEEHKELFTQMMQNLKYAALLGQGDACFYAAQLHYNGWIYNEYTSNKDNGDFLILLGQQLYSEKCLGRLDVYHNNCLLDNVYLDNRIYNCSKFITCDNSFYSDKKIKIDNNIKQKIREDIKKNSLGYLNVLFPTPKISSLLSFDIEEDGDGVNVSEIVDFSNVSLMGDSDTEQTSDTVNKSGNGNAGWCL
ncbi:hypothetical protein [Rickettsia endosymbiont of Polydrusus tereticollis]|uniref:hypothetical protein n=1 Tax=Rickettsia endosymbiont of Polydrusus tereticollis TaxID=3066251 RepID=UPI0031332D88